MSLIIFCKRPTLGRRAPGGQNIKYLPFSFTEHGAIMAANVLRSEQAEEMSVAVVRAFVRLRRLALSVEGLARKVAALENKYDASFRAVFDAIRDLVEGQNGVSHPKFLARALPFLYTTPNEISTGQASCFSPGSGTVSCVPPPGAA
jgi:hypothetical protein